MKLDQIIGLLVGAAFGIRLLDSRRAWWVRAAYGAVGFDLVRGAFAAESLLELPKLGAVGKATTLSGKTLRFQEHKVRNIQERVAYIHEQMVRSTRDPKVYALAREVVGARCGDDWCVPEKNGLKGVDALQAAVEEVKAIHAKVQERVRYTFDPTDYDAFQTADKTWELRTGDCFIKGTLVLRGDHQLVPIESLRVGDKIWGRDRWSGVTNIWEKGVLPTWNVRLNNGSSMRLTPDHKVWVASCEKHTTRVKASPCSCPVSERVVHRVTVRELRKGHVLLQPDRIPFGTGDMDPGRAYIEGLYLSDGWSDKYRFSISGKDGHPKEAQKREVESICAALGVSTRWHKRYIAVNDPEWTRRMSSMGRYAPQKQALSLDWGEGPAMNLLRGIMADSGKNSNGGSTFTTTSHRLFLQTRVLLKMAGLTASERYIEDHGGLGTHPIWRLGIRATKAEKVHAEKLLRVKEVVRDGAELPCCDIETDDHYVWLPEADWTTSQCDDMVVLEGAMLRTIGHKVRTRVVHTKPFNSWNHVFILVEMPNGKWVALDPIMKDRPAGWQVPRETWVREPFDAEIEEKGPTPKVPKAEA